LLFWEAKILSLASAMYYYIGVYDLWRFPLSPSLKFHHAPAKTVHAIVERLRRSLGSKSQSDLPPEDEKEIITPVVKPLGEVASVPPIMGESITLWPHLPSEDDPLAWSPSVTQQIRDFFDQATDAPPPPRPTDAPTNAQLGALPPWASGPSPQLSNTVSVFPVSDLGVGFLGEIMPQDQPGPLLNRVPKPRPVIREEQFGSPLFGRSDWKTIMYIHGRPTSDWTLLFQELGPLASSVLLDILSNPSAVAPVRSRDEILEQLRNELPARPDMPLPSSDKPIDVSGKKKSRRGRHPISIKDPKWDEIYRAVDLLVLVAQHHRPFSFEPNSGLEKLDIIKVGQALRFQRVREGVVSSQVADPVGGCWIELAPKALIGNPGFRRGQASSAVTAKLSAWTPMSWPVMSINNSSLVESFPSRMVHPLRDILADRQSALDSDFAINNELFQKTKLKPEHPFFKSAARVNVVLGTKIHASCVKRRANKGESVKAWWNSFVPRDVLSTLVNICGTNKNGGFTWIDVAALSSRPDRHKIIEKISDLGIEKKGLVCFEFDDWTAVSQEDLLRRLNIPQKWIDRWPKIKDLPTQSLELLMENLAQNSCYRGDDYIPALLRLESLDIAPADFLPSLDSDDASPKGSNALSFGLSRKSYVGGDWVDSGEYGRRPGLLPFDPVVRDRVIRNARALRSEIGEDDLASLDLVLSDLLALPEKLPPRAWEMLLFLSPSSWGRALRSASGVSGEFTADPSSVDNSLDLPPEVLARARHLCVASVTRMAILWPRVFPDQYRRWSAKDRSIWQEDAEGALTETVQKVEKLIKSGSKLEDETVNDIFSPGKKSSKFGAIMAAHEEIILKSLLPRRKRGRPRKILVSEDLPPPAAPRRKM
jgi:hypothetical protein